MVADAHPVVYGHIVGMQPPEAEEMELIVSNEIPVQGLRVIHLDDTTGEDSVVDLSMDVAEDGSARHEEHAPAPENAIRSQNVEGQLHRI